ncbi:MAG: SdiA-regulated family protein [Chitinophagaceae bacterium]|nr:SdiA-regulated family protein [Chitinophagaceae bacterium]
MRKYTGILIFFLVAACANSQRPARILPHYDLSRPEIFSMPDQLREISGFVILPGSNDSVLAEQDEEGKVYYFKLGDKKPAQIKFGAKGDFEDIALCENTVYLLRSDGQLFSFPLPQTRTGMVKDVKIWNGLPQGEYEGIFADQKNKKLYVLCKHCAGEKSNRTGGGSVFAIQHDAGITPAGNFRIDIREIEKLSATKKIDFHPSAISRHPSTGEWFILSAVNGMLVVADADWKIKDVYPLSKAVFNQPEGIAFDSLNNLYISNEGGVGAGNILKFAYKK